MALIFAAIAAAGAFNAAQPAEATAPDPIQTTRTSTCRMMEVTARADLIYRPDGRGADDKVVVVAQTRRLLDAGPREAETNDARAAATEPQKALDCARHHSGRDAP